MSTRIEDIMVRQTLVAAAVAVFALALGACSSSPPPDAETSDGSTEVAAPESAPAQPTVFDDQLKALEKAKQVEETLQKAQDDRDKAMEDAGI
jgi:hypothetical protein